MAFHGFALNVNNDLTPFQWINPCGLAGVRMTSLEQVLDREIPMAELRQTVWQTATQIFDVTLQPIAFETLDRLLSGEPPVSRKLA